MTPTQRVLVFFFFFFFFFGSISKSIFYEFWVRSGNRKSSKIAPWDEKVRSRMLFFAIFGASRRFMRFSVDLEAKNDEKSMSCSVRVFDAARFFFNPATLDFADRRSTSEGF